MLNFLKKLWSRYGEDEVANHAAALSYYAIFALGPLLFLVLGVIGLVVRHSGARAHLLDSVTANMGPDAAHALSNTLSSQGLGSKTGLAFWVGGIGLVLAAIGIFGQLQRALNDLLHVKPGPGAGFKPLIRQKIISLFLVGVVCALLVASLVSSSFLSALGGGHLFLFVLDFVSSLLILWLMLALIYRSLPAVKIDWGIILRVSGIVALLFTVGKLVLGLIIGHNGAISAYGAAGSLIALLLWIFYSGQLIYIGAAGMGLYLESRPQKIKPRYKGKKTVLKLTTRGKPL